MTMKDIILRSIEDENYDFHDDLKKICGITAEYYIWTLQIKLLRSIPKSKALRIVNESYEQVYGDAEQKDRPNKKIKSLKYIDNLFLKCIEDKDYDYDQVLGDMKLHDKDLYEDTVKMIEEFRSMPQSLALQMFKFARDSSEKGSHEDEHCEGTAEVIETGQIRMLSDELEKKLEDIGKYLVVKNKKSLTISEVVEICINFAYKHKEVLEL